MNQDYYDNEMNEYGWEEHCYHKSKFVSDDYTAPIGMDRGYAQKIDLSQDKKYAEIHAELKKAFKRPDEKQDIRQDTDKKK